MDMENIFTILNSYFPQYEARASIFIALIFSLATYFLIHKLKSNKIYKIIIPVLILLNISSYILLTIYFGLQLNQEIYILLSISAILLISQIATYLSRILKKNKVLKIISLITYILTTLSLILTLLISTFSKPIITSEVRDIDTTSSITLKYTVPVKREKIKIHISPENQIQTDFKYLFGIKDWVTGVTITPIETFLPEQRIVIYTTGLTRVFPYGQIHEQSLEYTTPKSPQVEDVVLGESTSNIPIDTDIILSLDTNDQQYILWEAEFIPTAEYEILRDHSNNVTIKPTNLKQGQDYELKLYKTIIQYNTRTNEETHRESQELINEIIFSTVKAPGITSFNREDDIISNNKPLEITFEQTIDPSSLEERIEITPKIEYTTSLSDDQKNLVITPQDSFSTDTKYTITLKSGIRNTLGGYIEKDIELTFTTPGKVSISSTYPGNGSTGLSTGLDYMYVTFNQPVDKKSAESSFSISPNISGSFSWRGNTMYYSFSNNLSYGTKYTYTLKSGIDSIYGIDSTSTYTRSFTTKNQTVLLNVPLYYQQESFTCNIAATKMVLGYKGISSSESSIKSAVGIGQNPDSDWVEEYGVHWGPISSYISSRGVSNSIKRGWNLTSALEEVKKGHPTLLYMYNGYTQPKGAFTLEGGYTGYKGMHSEILVGYVGTPSNPVQVIVLDPWRGKRYMSPSSFNSYWSYLNYTGIVIY